MNATLIVSAATAIGIIFLVLHFLRSSNEVATTEEDADLLAKLLVAEIKLYNEDLFRRAVADGNAPDELRDEIKRSRAMFDKRVAPELRHRFDSALAAVLAKAES